MKSKLSFTSRPKIVNSLTLLQKHFESVLLRMLHGRANWKEAKIERKFCVFKICCLCTQTRKQPESIQSQCFLSASQMLPCLLPHMTMLKTQNLRLENKNCFEISNKFFCVLDAILLPQQCFIVCVVLNETRTLYEM